VPASVVPAVPAPNLIGLTEQDAISQLNSAGLLLGTVTTAPSDTVPKGVVMAMAPAAGSQVPAGTTVDLTVSNGPAS
jgi:beta-lactam-binding protein with PASTA domain